MQNSKLDNIIFSSQSILWRHFIFDFNYIIDKVNGMA